jgi:site-specific DNA recombinase
MIVDSVDRFARDNYDHVTIRRFLGTLGITLRSATQPIDDTPEGELTEGLLALLAQYDNRQKARKVTAAMKAALASGHWVACAARLPSSADWKRPDHGHRSGPGTTSAARLRADGLGPPPAQRGPAVRHRDGPPRLRGQARLAGTFCRDPAQSLYIARLVGLDWGIDTRGAWEPLVPDEVFWRVQSQLAGAGIRMSPRLRNRREFPLRAFARCETCGKPLTGSFSRGKNKARLFAYYHCPGHARCKAVRISPERLEASWLHFLESLRPRDEYVRLFEAVVLEHWKTKHGDASARRAYLEAELARLKDRRTRLDNRFIYEEAIDRDTYQAHLARLAEETAVAEMQLHDARIEEIDVEGVLGFARQLAMNASRLWLEANLDQRQRLQAALCPQGIFVSRDGAIRTSATAHSSAT